MSSGDGSSLEVDFRTAMNTLGGKAAELRRFGAEAQAAAVEACLAELEAWFEGWLDEELPISKAAAEAGLSHSAAEKRLASGRWPNSGRPYKPSVKRRHLFKPRGGEARVESRELRAKADDLVDEVISSYEDTTCE